MLDRFCTCLLTEIKSEELYRSIDVGVTVLSKDCHAKCEVPSRGVDGEEDQLLVICMVSSDMVDVEILFMPRVIVTMSVAPSSEVLMYSTMANSVANIS